MSDTMKVKEGNKEVFGVLPTSKYMFLEDLNLSENSNLKNGINSAILKAMEIGRPKYEIKTLIDAGDIIDSISNQLMEGGS